MLGISMSGITLTGSLNTAKAQNPTAILDQHAYTMTGDMIIDLSSQNIIVFSNMLNCQQENGDPPIDTQAYALFTNNQFIGLNRFKYDVDQNTMVFISETNDLVCDNGVFVDVLHVTGFEAPL